MTTTRSRDPERTKRRIVDAAAKEFAQRGFDGTTLSAIARRAKLSKQLLHHHFGSKKMLFREAQDKRFRPAVDWQETLSDNPTELIATRFAKRGRDHDYLRYLAWEAASLQKRGGPGDDARQRRISEYGDKIRILQQNGKLPRDMDWRMIQLAILCLATYPIAFPQITRLVMGREAKDPTFQAEWTAFLQKVGTKLFG
jgi:TetR/AcrR family transcriptional regulator